MNSITSFTDLLVGSYSAPKQTSSSWQGKVIKTLSFTTAPFSALFRAIGTMFTFIASYLESAPIQTHNNFVPNYDDDIISYSTANGAIIGLRNKGYNDLFPCSRSSI